MILEELGSQGFLSRRFTVDERYVPGLKATGELEQPLLISVRGQLHQLRGLRDRYVDLLPIFGWDSEDSRPPERLRQWANRSAWRSLILVARQDDAVPIGRQQMLRILDHRTPREHT